jgi:hypothetical protein
MAGAVVGASPAGGGDEAVWDAAGASVGEAGAAGSSLFVAVG